LSHVACSAHRLCLWSPSHAFVAYNYSMIPQRLHARSQTVNTKHIVPHNTQKRWRVANHSRSVGRSDIIAALGKSHSSLPNPAFTLFPFRTLTFDHMTLAHADTGACRFQRSVIAAELSGFRHDKNHRLPTFSTIQHTRPCILHLHVLLTHAHSTNRDWRNARPYC
jgi:hypothetical protein